MMMSSSRESSGQPRLHRLFPWFDPETAAVVTILLGLFQVLLSVMLVTSDEKQPRLYILPLVMGCLIVAAGSFTMASERNPSKILVQGCACSNVVGLLGTVLAFSLYCYSLSFVHKDDCVTNPSMMDYDGSFHVCPVEYLAAYSRSVTLLLLFYDSGAGVLHCLLSVSAYKTLKTH